MVDAESAGLENALRVMKAPPENTQVGIRVDSGDIAEQCVLCFRKMREWGRYRRIELSAQVSSYQERFRAMRAREVEAARRRLAQ